MKKLFMIGMALVGWACSDPHSPEACDDSLRPPGTEVGAHLSTRGTLPNGLQMQGTLPNGLQMQGTLPNGTQLDGIVLEGLELEGTRLRSLNGRTPEGSISLIGLDSNGASVALQVAPIEGESGPEAIKYYVLTHEGRNLCGPTGKGLFVPGVWDSRGNRAESKWVGRIQLSASFSCATGAIAKCVVWGYAPDRVGAEVHQSCTRMVRADYCGDGESHTVDGTLIDVFDTIGVQHSEALEFQYEAAWGPEGATCVNKPRYATYRANGTPFFPSCWKDKPRCGSWSEATTAGAVLGNSSKVLARHSCQ